MYSLFQWFDTLLQKLIKHNRLHLPFINFVYVWHTCYPCAWWFMLVKLLMNVLNLLTLFIISIILWCIHHYIKFFSGHIYMSAILSTYFLLLQIWIITTIIIKFSLLTQRTSLTVVHTLCSFILFGRAVKAAAVIHKRCTCIKRGIWCWWCVWVIIIVAMKLIEWESTI